MPPKRFVAPKDTTPPGIAPLGKSITSPSNKLAHIPAEKRTGKASPAPDTSGTLGLSIDKHVEKQRYKIVYALDKLTDDLARATSSPRKKDKEYIKGIVWSVGVLFDKLASGTSNDALVVRIPARLLDNIKAVISVQVDRKAKLVDITPTALETISSSTPVESIGYAVPVAEVVAASDGTPSLDASPS